MALQLGVRLKIPSLLCAGWFTGLIPCRTCAGHDSCHVFVDAIVQLLPEDIVVFARPRVLVLTIFLLSLSPTMTLDLGVGVNVSLAEQPTAIYSLHFSCEILY